MLIIYCSLSKSFSFLQKQILEKFNFEKLRLHLILVYVE